jgi:hypothetical protein
MFYDKKKKTYFTEGEVDRIWVDKAWDEFIQEIYRLNSTMLHNILNEWVVINESGAAFIHYPKSYLKTHPKIKKELEIRNKLAKQTGEAYAKIIRVRSKK